MQNDKDYVIAELRDALLRIAALPKDGYEIAGMDCGNTGDIFEDGYQMGLKEAAAVAKITLAGLRMK